MRSDFYCDDFASTNASFVIKDVDGINRSLWICVSSVFCKTANCDEKNDPNIFGFRFSLLRVYWSGSFDNRFVS